MKLYSFNYGTELVIQVFINKEESEDTEIIRKINVLKRLYTNVSIFISGINDTVSTLKGIIEYSIKNNVENDNMM